MDRRKFIVGTGLAAFSLSAFGSILKTDENTFKGDCTTTNDILGPFYRPDAPIREDLTYAGLEGNVIVLRGKVFKSDCVTPLKNALVEIWHANAKGEYDNDSKLFNQRASALTNEKGVYSFKTIIPGKYLNGALYRPSHIHYRVSASGEKELISQIYFNGDPHIEKDPWASQSKAKRRILPIIPEDTTGNLTVLFDVFL